MCVVVQFKYESILKNSDEHQTDKLVGRGRQVHWFGTHRRQLFVLVLFEILVFGFDSDSEQSAMEAAVAVARTSPCICQFRK